MIPIKTICAWCQTLIQDGPPQPVSHGLCKTCCAKWNAELDAAEAGQA